jgi:hypothetical protein
MVAQRFVAPVLMAAALVVGCSKKDKDKAPPAESGSGTAMTNTPTPPPPPPTPPAGSGSAGSGSAAPAAGSGDTALPTGAPAKLSELVKINLPVPPPKAPAGGIWKEVGEVESDGDRQANYTAADNAIWYTLNIQDCRHPKAKEVAAKPAGDRGMWQWCFAKPDGKIKDYPRLTDENSLAHGVRVGNIVVIAGPHPTVKDKVGDAEVDEFLGSLDLAMIAKL